MKQASLVLAILLLATSANAGEGTAPFLKTTWDAGRIRQDLGQSPSAMMLSYWLWDRAQKEGKGASEATTSGGLGWGESSWLMNYVMCYEAFRDTYWLDKIVDHFDRMMRSLSDPEGSGFRAWRDRGYSVGLVRVTSKKGAEGLTLDPEVSKEWVNRDGGKVTAHNYSITFTTPNSIEVRDETDKKAIATKDYKGKIALSDIPGAKFTISGSAKAGARFEFDSTPGEEIQYQVHDGMITYPIAQFIEIVYGDPNLHARYKKKADQYLAFIDKDIRQKWESTWVELPDNCGAYVFTKHKTQRFPSALLPHNQYLALARTFIVLKDVPGIPNREVYLEKAEKMARYFRKNLHPNGDAWVWNYWDPYPPIPEVRPNVEDTSHGSIDIGFVVEACNRHVVFTDDDLKKFSNAYVEVMWNKSEGEPLVAGNVDGRKSKRDSRMIHEWMKLAQWNPKVWRLAMLLSDRGTGTGNAPVILYMLAGMAGIDATEIERFHQLKTEIEKGFAAGLPINGDFEMGEGERALGWDFGTWSNCKGRGAWVEGGYNGTHAIMLEGISGEINVVAFPFIHTKVDRPTKFRMSVYYRTEGDAKPNFSFIGLAGTGKQYVTSPILEKSKEWKKAEWEMTSAEGVSEFYFVLRNHGLGKVFYDDFRMEKE